MALSPQALPALLRQLQPDAIELHTHPGRASDFAERLQQIELSGVALQLLSVSCPEGPGDAMPQHLWQLHQLLQGCRHLEIDCWDRKVAGVPVILYLRLSG